MADEPVYNLLQAIDPSKIKVPISEKFSKLTLSSNKKKQQEQKVSVETRQLRDSTSRNLLKQLSEINSNESSSSLRPEHTNPLLFSDSSKEHIHDKSEEKIHVGEYYETTMDSLNITDEYDEAQANLSPIDLDVLTQKISAMSVVCRPATSSLADSLNDVTQLVSTESQRSSMSDVQKFHNVKEIPLKICKKEMAAMSSSSESLEQDSGSVYEITDDDEALSQDVSKDETDKRTTDDYEQNKKEEEEKDDDDEDEDEDEDEAITISDSSECATAEGDQPTQMAISMSTLDDLQIGERTLNEFRNKFNLPVPTLSRDKMERVAAFLRDVSMDQRKRLERGCVDVEDSICNYNLPPEEKEQMEKARQIKSADTESMTPEEEEKEETPETVRERQRRLRALEESEESAEAAAAETNIQTPKNRERRLVSADTVENSIISNDSEKDSLIYLQVTPTPRRGIFEPSHITAIKNLFSQMPGLKLTSPQGTKTPMTVKRNDNFDKNSTDAGDLSYYSPGNQQITPKSLTKSNKTGICRITSAETEPNTLNENENFSSENSLKTQQKADGSLFNIDTQEHRTNSGIKSCRLASAETEPNTVIEDEFFSPTKSPNTSEKSVKTKDCPLMSKVVPSPKSELRRGERRFVSADTEENTMSDLQLSNSSLNSNKLSSSRQRNERCLVLNDTEVNTCTENLQTNRNINHTIPSSPVYKTPEKKCLNGSVNSFHSLVSSSNDEHCHDSAPENSITILETDEENSREIQTPPEGPHPHDYKKLSSSFQDNVNEDTDSHNSSMSQIRMSMANINISAKINIKITIPDTAETSEDDASSSQGSIPNRQRNTNSLTQNQHQNNESICSSSADEKDKNSSKNEINQAENNDNVEIIIDSDKSDVEDEKFVETAAKLLTELYGNTWQTPDVLRKLKKPNDNKKVHSLKKIQKTQINRVEEKTTSGNKEEESVLGDFNMFRQNIVKKNGMDSTRLYTPNRKNTTNLKTNKVCRTEPRKPLVKNKEFLEPQTKSCRKPPKTPRAKITAQQIRSQTDRWRQLVDNDTDSDGNNASDDEDAAETDTSWKCSNASISGDSDLDIATVKPKKRNKTINRKAIGNKSKDDIIYLDLSKEEVEVQENVPESPPANHDVTFASKLNEILKTCRREDKPKLTPSSGQPTKTRRKLYTPIFTLELDDTYNPNAIGLVDVKEKKKPEFKEDDDVLLTDKGFCPLDGRGKLNESDVCNKILDNIRDQLTPPRKKVTAKATPGRKALKGHVDDDLTPKSKLKPEIPIKPPTVSSARKEIASNIEVLYKTPSNKYSFLKSLDVAVSNTYCHPDARVYRDNYRLKKEELSRILYDLYNDKIFKNALDVPITWNKKLLNTAGRCLNKKKLGVRSSVIELSEKVLTSADRLRCTLIHELCHAATWIFNGEGGHGRTWKEWTYKANSTFPELPKIGVCHQYEIQYKYTYKCTLCAAKSYAHSKSKKVENIRCSYCHGAIEIFLNKKDKDGNIMATPVREPTGFAKFVKDNYKKHKRVDIKHADVMKILSNEFANMKVKPVA